MTQVNELTYEKHVQMYFIEFLEVISRVADNINLMTFEIETEQQLTAEERKNQPLHIKLEGFI